MTYYHYCSVDTFFKIIANSEIWLTDFIHMNDSTEGEWGDNRFLEHLKKLKPPIDEKYFQQPRFIKSAFKYFLFCMSKEGDMLSQWRAYGDDGRGFAIGFSDNAINRHRLNSNPDHKLIFEDVRYSEEEQFKFISEKAEEQNYLIEQLVDDERNIIIDALDQVFSAYRFAMKPESFHEEKEVRLIYKRSLRSKMISHERGAEDDLRYFPTKDRLKSYIPLELTDGDIEKVFVGPKNKTDDFDLENFLINSNFRKKIEICRSDIPYV